MAWRVQIGVNHDLAFDLTEGDQFTDEITVLSGLRLGWAIPNKIIWPTQPDPQVASFQLNAPSFDDVAAIVRGGDIEIQVQAMTSGPVIASFYGVVTDLRAVVRPGRPGVFVSVAAVESILELAEFSWRPVAVGFPAGYDTFTALEALWDDAGVTPPLDVDLWTATGAQLGSMNVGANTSILDFVKDILDQSPNAAADTRMILAPLTYHSYTLDTIRCSPPAFEAFVLDSTSKVIRESFQWATAKGMAPAIVVVESVNNGGAGGFPGVVTTAQAGSPDSTRENLGINVNTSGQLDDVAAFYSSHTADRWQPSALKIPVTRAGIGDLIPTGLFPDWSLPEGDAERANCYARDIVLFDVDTTVTPAGGEAIEGSLTGAELNIINGDLDIALTIRARESSDITEPEPEIPPDTGLELGGYGDAPYGGLTDI